LQTDLANNRAPGRVHVERHGAVFGIHTPIAKTQRQKKRMVMTTFGKPIYDCTSVFEFLKVMYDTLEGETSLISVLLLYDLLIVHRWVLNVKGILHRDISINNILLPLEPIAIDDIKCRPKFIDEILDPKSGSSWIIRTFFDIYFRS
jgi:hypothetical protein